MIDTFIRVEYDANMYTYRDSNCVDPQLLKLYDMGLGEPSFPVLCEFLVNSFGIGLGECTRDA